MTNTYVLKKNKAMLKKVCNSERLGITLVQGYE